MVLSAGLVFTSCSGPCTLIGCLNELTFGLGPAAQHFGLNEAVQVKACVGTQCATETVTATAAGSSSSSGTSLRLGSGTLAFNFGAAVSGSQTVSIELTKNGAVVFTDSRDGVAFISSQPNGPGCSPTCQQD